MYNYKHYLEYIISNKTENTKNVRFLFCRQMWNKMNSRLNTTMIQLMGNQIVASSMKLSSTKPKTFDSIAAAVLKPNSFMCSLACSRMSLNRVLIDVFVVFLRCIRQEMIYKRKCVMFVCRRQESKIEVIQWLLIMFKNTTSLFKACS